MPWLEYGGRLRKLPEGVAVLGSGRDATLVIEDVDLMPRHLIVHPHSEHVEVSAFSPAVVVVVGEKQVGAEPCRAAYGAPIRAGSAEFRVWKEQPVHREVAPRVEPHGYLVDPQAVTAYRLDRLSTNIGRATANVIRLPDPTASRYHAQVRREAGGFALHVIGSAGGSVNGRRVGSPCLLHEGDIVELAYTTLHFTQGPVPEGFHVLPSPAELSGSERPTLVRERITVGPRGTGALPSLVRTAIVAGVAVALAALLVAVVLL